MRVRVRDGGERVETSRQRLEDATLLALKMKESSHEPKNPGRVKNLEKESKWVSLEPLE